MDIDPIEVVEIIDGVRAIVSDPNCALGSWLARTCVQRRREDRIGGGCVYCCDFSKIVQFDVVLGVGAELC